MKSFITGVLLVLSACPAISCEIVRKADVRGHKIVRVGVFCPSKNDKVWMLKWDATDRIYRWPISLQPLGKNIPSWLDLPPPPER